MPAASIATGATIPRVGQTKDAVFALSASRTVVHVSEVARGKACDCFCVACGSPVIAKQGNQTAWHFAHLSKADCLHAAETALHKAVKQVIFEGRAIGLPGLVVEARASVEGHVGHASRCLAGRKASYVEPRLEVRLGEIVADAVIQAHGRELIVEVAVTHKVDEEKLKKLATMQIPSLELEAWRLDRNADWQLIRSFVSESLEARKWLFNPRSERLFQEAQADAHKRAQAMADAARAAQIVDKSQEHPPAARGAQRRWAEPAFTGDWQIDAAAKLKRLWSRYRSDRLITVTPSFPAADMILRWDEKEAHEGDEKSHFESLVAVLANIAHITYRDENGVVTEVGQIGA